ncbi:MAG: hypothetical protein HC897_04900 [Thermoanaerobaculia bacterium]|nr:hypothetical protein [Thermoanaerobaculia bacterium]
MRGSYVSLHSALAHHGLIPEHVPITTSVGPGRNQRRSTPLGVFDFRHLKPTLRAGARWVELGGGQRALVAIPEKALLDLVYLVPGADSPEYLEQLRLQNLERLDLAELALQEQAVGKPKLSRAAAWIRNAAETEAEEYELL